MKIEFANVYFEEKKELMVQRDEVERYRGYLIVSEDDNGSCKIVKPAKIKLVVETDKPQKLTFNVTDKVLDLYPNCEDIQSSFRDFAHDALHGKLKFELSEHYSLIIAR